MPSELYRTYEVLVEESVHPDHPKRERTSKPCLWEQDNGEKDAALRDTHMIFQDAVCYYTLCIAGLAGNEKLDGKPLNPLWNYLTTPAEKGGIKEDTAKVIRRLAAHYKSLTGVKTAEEFLNRVYSEPMRTPPGISDGDKQPVMLMRAQCYRLLEMYGAPTKDTGAQECADMSAFARTWVSLTSAPDSDAEIPGNGAYDRVSWELKAKLKPEMDEKQAAEIVESTLLEYSREAEDWNTKDCASSYAEKTDKLRHAVIETEKLPDANEDKPKTLRTAKAALEKHLSGRADFEKKFFANRKDKLGAAVVSALSKPFAADKASDIGLTDDEFQKAKKDISSLAEATETKGHAHIRLSYKGGNPNSLEKAVLRYWLLRDNPDKTIGRAALADFRRFIEKDDPIAEPKLGDTRFREMPFKRANAKIAFPFFGKECLKIKSDAVSPDFEFDKTAFATAAEDVFKYKIRTAVRAEKVRKFLNVVRAYEGMGKTLAAEDSPTGKLFPIRGMQDDPRWKGNGKGIETLLVELGKDKDIETYIPTSRITSEEIAWSWARTRTSRHTGYVKERLGVGRRCGRHCLKSIRPPRIQKAS